MTEIMTEPIPNEPVDAQETVTTTAPISYWTLLYKRFIRNRLAVISLIVMATMYILTLAAEFVAPYSAQTRFLESVAAPPQLPRFIDAEGNFHLRPFVYGLEQERDPYTFERIYVLDEETRYPLQLFVRGEPYELLFIQSDIHLFGVEGTPYFMFGTDSQGRDLLSRIIYGSRVSTTVGLLGVAISLFFGLTIGMLSGYLGGTVDQIIQRTIEVILSFPSIPLWLALAAALPKDWSALRIFFLITIILSFINWGHLARIVRGMTLAFKNEEYVLSAKMNGGGIVWIIRKHLFPANLSYAIVSATLAIPGMILAETSLSFLGLGIQPPIVSWGTLLQDAQDVSVLSQLPWLILPAFFVIGTVLAFNFVGDGLRDAVDPYSRH
jgi:peptide/nickel transport system permease protein